MYVQSQNFGNGYSMKSTYHEGEYIAEPRIHQFSEIIYVFDGEAKITVEDRTERASRGDVAVITPFLVHSVKTTDDASIWIGRFSGNMTSDFISGESLLLGGERSVFTPSEEMGAYFRHILPEEYESFVDLETLPTVYRKAKALISCVFEEYMRLVELRKERVRGGALSEVLLYMGEHYRENITLSTVCSALGFSKSYVSRSISAVQGASFRGLLNSLRIQYARALLATKDYKIIDVAYECGFAEERSFYRAFKELVGISPGEYRAKKRG